MIQILYIQIIQYLTDFVSHLRLFIAKDQGALFIVDDFRTLELELLSELKKLAVIFKELIFKTLA